MAKSVFSKAELYHLADSIVSMYDRSNLVYKFAVSKDDKEVMNAYNGMIWELNLLIETYGLRKMIKIDE